MMRSKLRAAIVLALALEVIVATAKAETIECHAKPETREGTVTLIGNLQTISPWP